MGALLFFLAILFGIVLMVISAIKGEVDETDPESMIAKTSARKMFLIGALLVTGAFALMGYSMGYFPWWVAGIIILALIMLAIYFYPKNKKEKIAKTLPVVGPDPVPPKPVVTPDPSPVVPPPAPVKPVLVQPEPVTKTREKEERSAKKGSPGYTTFCQDFWDTMRCFAWLLFLLLLFGLVWFLFGDCIKSAIANRCKPVPAVVSNPCPPKCADCPDAKVKDDDFTVIGSTPNDKVKSPVKKKKSKISGRRRLKKSEEPIDLSKGKQKSCPGGRPMRK